MLCEVWQNIKHLLNFWQIFYQRCAIPYFLQTFQLILHFPDFPRQIKLSDIFQFCMMHRNHAN